MGKQTAARPARRRPVRWLLAAMLRRLRARPPEVLPQYVRRTGGTPPTMPEASRRLALATKGFLAEAEGLALFELAAEASAHAPCLEVGSYCGRSTIFLGQGCRVAGKHPLFAVDHHGGSPEQQPGEPYFDPSLLDREYGGVTTLPQFMRSLRRADLLDWVIPIVADSRRASRYWSGTPLGLLFIDGGHSREDAFQDFHGWSRHVVRGGYLCIHDIFTDPAAGGQAPYQVLAHARASGRWDYLGQVETLGILRRR